MEPAQALGVDVWDTSGLPFGSFNSEEAFADCFATYFLSKGELKSRYPRWLDLVEVVLGKKKAVGPDLDKLTKYAKRAYQQSIDMALSNEERASITAVTVGRQAKRLGFTKEQVTRWLQSAYGAVWVKGGNLNPGADLKEIRTMLFRAMR